VILEFRTTNGEVEPDPRSEADDADPPAPQVETTVLHLRQRGFPEADKEMFDRG
jgi:hypothetical protein